MQAIILAAGRGYRLNQLTKNNTKCMIEINGVSLIERMLRQLVKFGVNDIIIVNGYQKDILEQFVSSLNLEASIKYITNEKYLETNNIYSLYLAKDYMVKDESLIIDSDIIFDDCILEKLIQYNGQAVAVIDKYKSWMTGKSVDITSNMEILGFTKENEINHLNMKNSYKTVGMYRFSADYFENYYLPFLEAYLKVYGNDDKYEQVLDILSTSIKSKVDTCFVEKGDWYEINDIQDVDLASTLFSDDEEKIAGAMLGRWGGYWRYPEYLDYFYLVTPYYPTKALMEELKANFDDLLLQYPSGMRVNSLLAAKEFLVEPENIVVGNGAAELIKSIMSIITGRTGFIKPTFEEYPNRLYKEDRVDLLIDNENFTYNAIDIINYFKDKQIQNLVLVNPENPSGNYINKDSMKKLLDWTKQEHIKTIIDESFVDFVDELDPTLIKQEILDEYTNLYVIKSISKSYGVPGLRLGILASGDIETIAWMKKDVSIWNINSFAEFYMQIAGKYRKDYSNALELFRDERKRFQEELSAINSLRVIPSQANYIMVELLDNIDAEWLKRKMLVEEKIFIKTLGGKIKNGRNYLRLAIRNREDNTQFVQSLKRILDPNR